MHISRILTLAVISSVLTITQVASAQQIGFVINGAPQSFDTGWGDRLTLQGYDVTYVQQNVSWTDPSLASIALYIVSSDVGSGTAYTSFGDAPQGLITYEYGLYDEFFGITNNGTTGGVANNLSILDAGNPLAAGLSGDVSVYTGGGGGSRGLLSEASAGTDVIASSVADPLQAILMVLQPGQIGGGGNTWSGVRIAVPAYADWDSTLVTADGWTLLDNAVTYAIPEPSSFALLGLGLAAFLARRKGR